MKCEKCGKDMVLKVNKSNQKKFWACPGYPECSNTKPYDETAKQEVHSKAGEYHLTPEQCRSNALDFGLKFTIELSKTSKAPLALNDVLQVARLVEPYIFGVTQNEQTKK